MKLKYIELYFENIDSIKIEGKYIGYFLVDDLKTSIQRIACNSIDKMDIANMFAIEIHKDANKERYQFDQVYTEKFKQMTFDRIKKHADITSIEFELEEDYVAEGQISCVEHYSYYVHWTGDSEYTNEAQKTYLSKDGNLYIVIADKQEISDIFDLDEINDNASMDIHFNLCNVGDKYSNPDRYKNKKESKNNDKN